MIQQLKGMGILGVLFALGMISACSGSGRADQNLNPNCGTGKCDSASLSYLERLDQKSDYQGFLTSTNGFSFVKFTYEIAEPEQTIYFQNTSKYPFHHPFLANEVPKYKGISEDLLYRDLALRTCREGVALGAIYYTDKITLPGTTEAGAVGFTVSMDAFDECRLSATYERLKQQVKFVNGRIGFVFERLQDYNKYALKLESLGIPAFRAKQFFGSADNNVTYNQAMSYGYLKQLDDAAMTAGDYSSKDILVLQNVPRDIGPVAGVITSEMQVPASHVVLRCINQKIPDLYVVNAATNAQITRSLGRLVQFEAGENGAFTIRNSDDLGETELTKQAEAYFLNRVPVLPDPEFDLSVVELYDWHQQSLTRDQYKGFGTKSVNFGVLDNALVAAGVDRTLFGGGFSIPFSYYHQHIAQALNSDLCEDALKKCQRERGANNCLPANQVCLELMDQDRTMSDFLSFMSRPEMVSKMMADPVLRKDWLEYGRRLIEEAHLSGAFLQALVDKIGRTYHPTVRMRFRSSTNSEDLPGLNGAGFYESKAGCVADGDGKGDGASACLTPEEAKRTQGLIDMLRQKDPDLYKDLIANLQEDLTKKRPVDKAIKKVFASLWTDKAFLFRDYYRIDHQKVFMGILVHPSFADEDANGVVFSGPGEEGFDLSVVAQINSISITNPEIFDAVPDQFIVTVDPDGIVGEAEYLSRSNQIPSDQTVLSEMQIDSLAKQIQIVYEATKAFLGAPDSFRMDSEFKLDSQGQVLIKQARPLN